MDVNRKMKRFKSKSGTITLSDVAKVAGVSLGTASNAFNRPELVRAEVRQLIETAARELGYSGPDPKGRLLMGSKANAIGVLPPGDMPVAHAIRSPFFRDFILGIAEVCDEHSASLLIVSGAEDKKTWAIRNALVDGFILGHVDEVGLVRHRKVPFVVMDMDAGPEVSSVRIHGRTGARRAAEHLIGLGHRRFAILAVLRKQADPVWRPPAESDRQLSAGFPLDHEKLLGYSDALAAVGISINDVPMVESSPWAETGASMLLNGAPEATAILAMSDRQALAILEEARGRGIKIPTELSVVGFDDVPNAIAANPPLTTVAQPTVEKGRVAARILFEGGPPRHEVLPVELIVRCSTSSPSIQ
jgi:DNA-binding LacI/PurR family transcriptional regulator